MRLVCNFFRNELVIIAIARYYNLLTEYLVLLATAWLLVPEVRGEYVMLVSVISFGSMIAGLAFEQYGSAFNVKYAPHYDAGGYFKWVSYFAFIIGVGVSLFCFNVIGSSLIESALAGVCVLSITLYKQCIVLYQVNENIVRFSKIFVMGRSIYLIFVMMAAYFYSSVFAVLVSLALASLLHAAIAIRALKILGANFEFRDFQNYFIKAKWLYVTSVVTGFYGFVDLYIVYSWLSKASLSEYNLAMQLNAAIAVLGQAYTVYIYSSRERNSLENIINSTKKVNVIIIAVSILAISMVYSPPFAWIVNGLLHETYPNLYSILMMTIWLLPPALVSMFYAPLWIISGRYGLLFGVSLISIGLFTFCALNLVDKGLIGIVYAQYIAASLGLIINYGYYYYVKRKFEKC